MNSAQFALADGVALNVTFAHGLGKPPAFLRAVILCTNNDCNGGYLPPGCIFKGTELAIITIFNDSNVWQVFGVGADATFIYLSRDAITPPFTILNWLGGAGAVFTSFNNFSLKVYWK